MFVKFELLSIRRTWISHFKRLPLIVYESLIVAVLSFSCWFDICLASVSSKFSEDISDGMHQASSQLSWWFTIVKSWHLSRIFSAWSLCCIELLFIRCSEMKRHSWCILVFSLHLFPSLRSCPLCLQGKKMFKLRLLPCCLGCWHHSFFLLLILMFFFIDINI